jgi:hypothetical protein
MVSNVRLERILLEKIIKQAKKEFNKKVIFLKKQISPIIYEAVYNSSEMSSVRSGFLRHGSFCCRYRSTYSFTC